MTRVLDGLPVSGGIVEGRPVIVNVPASWAVVPENANRCTSLWPTTGATCEITWAVVCGDEIGTWVRAG